MPVRNPPPDFYSNEQHSNHNQDLNESLNKIGLFKSITEIQGVWSIDDWNLRFRFCRFSIPDLIKLYSCLKEFISVNKKIDRQLISNLVSLMESARNILRKTFNRELHNLHKSFKLFRKENPDIPDLEIVALIKVNTFPEPYQNLNEQCMDLATRLTSAQRFQLLSQLSVILKISQALELTEYTRLVNFIKVLNTELKHEPALKRLDDAFESLLVVANVNSITQMRFLDHDQIKSLLATAQFNSLGNADMREKFVSNLKDFITLLSSIVVELSIPLQNFLNECVDLYNSIKNPTEGILASSKSYEVRQLLSILNQVNKYVLEADIGKLSYDLGYMIKGFWENNPGITIEFGNELAALSENLQKAFYTYRNSNTLARARSVIEVAKALSSITSLFRRSIAVSRNQEYQSGSFSNLDEKYEELFFNFLDNFSIPYWQLGYFRMGEYKRSEARRIFQYFSSSRLNVMSKVQIENALDIIIEFYKTHTRLYLIGHLSEPNQRKLSAFLTKLQQLLRRYLRNNCSWYYYPSFSEVAKKSWGKHIKSRLNSLESSSNNGVFRNIRELIRKRQLNQNEIRELAQILDIIAAEGIDEKSKQRYLDVLTTRVNNVIKRYKDN